MTYVPDWERVRVSKAVAAVCLGELSLETPRAKGARAAAARLCCPIVMVPGAHNGLRDRAGAASQVICGILER